MMNYMYKKYLKEKNLKTRRCRPFDNRPSLQLFWPVFGVMGNWVFWLIILCVVAGLAAMDLEIATVQLQHCHKCMTVG